MQVTLRRTPKRKHEMQNQVINLYFTQKEMELIWEKARGEGIRAGSLLKRVIKREVLKDGAVTH